MRDEGACGWIENEGKSKWGLGVVTNKEARYCGLQMRMAKKDEQENKTGFWWKVYLVYAFLLLFALAIVLRMGTVIFVEGEELLGLSRQQSLSPETTEAVRGNIYSADSSLLAVSVPLFNIRLDLHPSVVANDTFFKYLRPLCDSLHEMYPARSKEQYRQFLLKGRREKRRSLLLKRNVTYMELARMREFPIFEKGQFAGGFIVEEHERRRLPNGYLAARTIGYYNQESHYGVGLERTYDAELRGKDGFRLTQRIAGNVWRPVYSKDEVEPENGHDLITTIDIRIQDVAEAALQECMETNEAQHGCVVLMEVQTGKVVAIANLRKQEDGSYAEVMNYAVGEAVEPGSTFKLASTIAILEESHIDTAVKVPTGRLKYYSRWMNDSHREGWGELSFLEAFEKSSNVGISYLANEVFHSKQQRFVDYLCKMHLDRPLGLEIAGEGEPYIKNTSDKTWSGISLPWMSIGYEVKVTPMQILSLYNAVANDGKMVKPMFVQEIRRGNEVIRSFKPTVLVDKICSDQTLATVQAMLQGVVERGTATNLRNSLYKVAAKTGTAQMNYGQRGSERMTYRASVVGYFPADNPRYSCIVMITNPQKNRIYGGSVAGPVFREIADKVFATLMKGGEEPPMMHPDQVDTYMAGGYAEDIEKVYAGIGIESPQLEPTTFVRLRGAADNAQAFDEVSLVKDVVPNLTGMGLRDASYLLERYGLSVRIQGKGRVKRQEPRAGSPCRKGQTVLLYLG